MGLFSKKIGLGDIMEALATMSDEDKAQILSALTPSEEEATEETTEATEETTEAEEEAETVEAVEEATDAAEEAAEEETTTEETTEATEEEAEEETDEGGADIAGLTNQIEALSEVINALAVRVANIEKASADAEPEEIFGIEMAEGIAADGKNEEESLRKEVFGF